MIIGENKITDSELDYFCELKQFIEEDVDIFLNDIDIALRDLGKSDSSVEYAFHIREKFSKVLMELNLLKYKVGKVSLIKDSEWYFD